MTVQDKSLEELRAAIDEDNEEDPNLEAGTQEEEKSEPQEASEEGTTSDPSEEDPSEGKSEEDEWIIPGRVKTQEDLLKAYGELESFAGRQGSEIQKLRTAVTEPPRKGETSDAKQTRIKKFAEAVQADPIAAIDNIVQERIGQVKNEAQAKEFERAYHAKKQSTKFNELEPTMVQIAERYGYMIQANGLQNDPALLEILELAAEGVRANELANKAKSEGVKQGQDLHRKKAKAKIEGSSGTKKTRKLNVEKLTAAQMKEAVEKGDLEW